MKVWVGSERPLILIAAASGLLLAALLESIFLNAYAGEAILATLFGIPAAWFVVRFALRIKTVEIDVFSPVVAFPVAYVLWFGLGSLTFIIDTNPPPYLYFALGFLAYIAGTLVATHRLPVVGERQRAPKGNPWTASHFRFVMLILFLLMAGSYILLIAQIGIPAIHEDVAIRRDALGQHHYLVDILLSSALTVTSFAAVDLWSKTRVLTPVTSVALIILAFLMQGSFGNRGFVATPLLMLLLLWHYWKRPLAARRLAVICAAMFVASVAYDYSRASAIKSGADDYTAAEVVSSSSAFTLHTNLSNLRDIMAAIPTEVPYQHGYLTFGAVFQVLPGHHESSDEFFKRILANDFLGGGQPGTLLAPFYGDFGRAGILLGMFLFGIFSAKVHGWMKEKPELIRVLLYCWFAQTALFSLYGALLTYFITLWVPFMWWALHRWMRTLSEGIVEGSHERIRSLRPA